MGLRAAPVSIRRRSLHVRVEHLTPEREAEIIASRTPRANEEFHREMAGIALSFRNYSLEKPPSAELRPDQKDSDSLPPYDVLDAVLEAYVEDSHSAERIAADRGFDIETVRRVIRMVDRAEYKRQQAAPGLKISDKAFGYGRRFPIAAKNEI